MGNLQICQDTSKADSTLSEMISNQPTTVPKVLGPVSKNTSQKTTGRPDQPKTEYPVQDFFEHIVGHCGAALPTKYRWSIHAHTCSATDKLGQRLRFLLFFVRKHFEKQYGRNIFANANICRSFAK